ncbi:MAG: YfdX family protein, partial [Thermoproteota archaeon]|nr:YfdX family protein [Thermoproteota archaeon]
TSTNQTGTAALSANLTQVDFELLKQDLTEARQALENNDTTALLDELSSASGELFQVVSNQFDPVHVEAITQEFNPLQTHLDQAQEEALKGEQMRTLEELNAAESELLKITKMLPSTLE